MPVSVIRTVTKLAPIGVICAVAWVTAWASRSSLETRVIPERGVSPSDITPVVAALDKVFADRWAELRVTPAPRADELRVLRRMALALVGAPPSLEELRDFEGDTRPDRLAHFARRYLGDARFGEYLSERLARTFVGTEVGQFILFRRDRFKEWLSDQLMKGTPYDQMVRTMISAQGLSTGEPEVNFVAAALVDGNVDYNKLAGRTVRAFLGQRIDCAQCHDHPFDHWKQMDFEGLAAFYGQTKQTITGVEDRTEQDGKPVEFMVQDRKTLKDKVIAPRVPFMEDKLAQDKSRREQLAEWVTHADNRRFERAIVNRVWGILFGKAYFEPVDDLPDPDEKIAVLDLLGKDFREHGCDLRRLIQVIVASRAFQTDSSVPDDASEGDVLNAEQQWGVYPLIRHRPEQMIRSMRQAASAQTHDHNTHLFLRIPRYFQEFDFVKEYGDLGENELQDRGGTIPQRLLMMNGNLARDEMKASPLLTPGRIASMSATDEQRVETAYLACLTRRPTADELAHFVAQLKGKTGDDRGAVMEDMFWSLFNSTEFAWNH
jgi:hypothetical protein